jgi:hypothetical protein
VGAGGALFDPADVQRGRPEVDLIPAQVEQLGHSQPMAVGDEDHGGVAMAPAVVFGFRHKPFDLSLGQVHAGP